MQHAITGTITVAMQKVEGDVFRLVIEVKNQSSLAGPALDRGEALLRSLISAHLILRLDSGAFISLLDPPSELQPAAAACRNIGGFPVLAGDPGQRDMLLCSPILLYDYPQIAPESAGDFYDATEMDEMLTLRVMTLTSSRLL